MSHARITQSIMLNFQNNSKKKVKDEQLRCFDQT